MIGTADVTKILTRREMQAVLADLKRKASRSKNTRLNLVIFRLAACCGLRASEIAQLVMADVRMEMPRPHLRIRTGLKLAVEGTASDRRRYRQSLNEIYNTDIRLRNMIDDLIDSDNDFIIRRPPPGPDQAGGFDANNDDDAQNGNGTGGIVLVNPMDTNRVQDGGRRNRTSTLCHELGHAWEANQGIHNPRPHPDSGIPISEENASQIENIYNDNGPIYVSPRTIYGGQPLSDSNGDSSPLGPIGGRPPNGQLSIGPGGVVIRE